MQYSFVLNDYSFYSPANFHRPSGACRPDKAGLPNYARWPLGLRVLYGSLRYVRKVTMFVNMMSFFCYFFEFVRNLLSCDLAARYIIVLIMFSYWVYMWLLHYHFLRDLSHVTFFFLTISSLTVCIISQSIFIQLLSNFCYNSCKISI